MKLSNAVAVCDIMSREIQTVTSECAVAEAARQMADAAASSVMVIDGGRLIGILTARDFLPSILRGDATTASVGTAMSTPVCSVGADVTLTEAASMLCSRRLSQLPVTDRHGRVLGIVTAELLLESLNPGMFHPRTLCPSPAACTMEDDERYRRLFESAGDAILVLHNHRVVDCNSKALEWYGLPKVRLIGQTLSLLSTRQQPDERDFEGTIRARVNAAMAGVPQVFEWRFLRGDGSTFDAEISMNALLADGETLVQATIRDIGERIKRRRMFENEIKHLAFYDPLTGLANRTFLLDRLRQALSASARTLRQGALLYIDLDHFKSLNDTLGHDQGDLLLQQVAHRLLDCVRENDTVARFGGDEFVVMLEDLSDVSQEPAARAQTVGEKILGALNQPYVLAGQDYPITPSIGITLFINHRDTVDELLKQADLAMYQAKASGRNALRFFDPAMQAALEARAGLVAELRTAVKERQFLLHYQPQVDRDGRVLGVEALLRWRHPHRGLVLPETFVPLAEDTGLIRPLGQWVLDEACRQLAAWGNRPDMSRLTLAVNVSARQLRQPDFVDQVFAVLARSGADPRRLKLELTESVLLDDAADVIEKLTVLKSRGVGFSLDDFGTGYSSLCYLKQLPLDELKIAQSFVAGILTDANDATIARTILSLGQTFGLAVIAEGVETPGQRDFLARHGCTAFQGYLYGEPGPAERVRVASAELI